jgi:hypothetical protein
MADWGFYGRTEPLAELDKVIGSAENESDLVLAMSRATMEDRSISLSSMLPLS